MQFFSSDLENRLPLYHLDKITEEEYKIKLRKAVKPFIKIGTTRVLHIVFMSIPIQKVRSMKEKTMGGRKQGKQTEVERGAFIPAGKKAPVYPIMSVHVELY